MGLAVVYDTLLADRIRNALAGEDVREVEVDGGLSFIVNEKLTVRANEHGHLMVLCDPETVGDVHERKAANWTGIKDRAIPDGWVRIKFAGYEDGEDFDFWMTAALHYSHGTS